ncbi:MAG: 50S ribosomal protein L4 [Chloroflexota bacterium]|nr:50S ribosomal protein L4 [Chloroflexota bacterium]
MMQLPVYNMAGEAIEAIELADDIFGIIPNVAVMHQAFERQRANARQGTHKTKKRSEVSGGGRKPWRQKGTGRARQGSIRAPQWKGGGTVFGPQPRSYDQKLNLKMRRLALRSALAVKAADEQIVVVDKLEMPKPKTKEMVALLERLGLDTPTLILLDVPDRNVELSARNLSHVKTLRATYLSVRDLLSFDRVLMSRRALEAIEETFGAP